MAGGYSLEDGEKAVRIARDVVDRHVRGEEEGEYDVPKSFQKKGGAFVTLCTFPGNDLRGCIGYPYPIFPLIETLTRSARSAATADYRFNPISPRELDNIMVEVSLLSTPERIVVKKRKDIPKEIVVGKHGLMVEKDIFKGLLLPQVAVEWNWDSMRFLEETCLKAKLAATMWKMEDVKVYRFTGAVFHELT
ncbi:MAG: TIGR00296 family protein, partial [Thermoplasmata archaeon]|nr:TIGR00296 family protein [Thermoplasmata archaeon]